MRNDSRTAAARSIKSGGRSRRHRPGLFAEADKSGKLRLPAAEDAAMNYVDSRRNQSREWVEIPVADNGEAIVAAMTEAGVEFVFFTSGSEIGFYQEAIAKAEAQGRKAPKLITVTHEHSNLNAALGCAAVSGKPVATAAHVDCGTQHFGGAVHSAWHAGLPVLIHELAHVWQYQRFGLRYIVSSLTAQVWS
jgi:hypothetical protein